MMHCVTSYFQYAIDAHIIVIRRQQKLVLVGEHARV